MKLWKTTLITTSILFSGCMVKPPINWSNPAETESRVKIKNDTFKKIITYSGPDIGSSPDVLMIRANNFLKTNSISYQIYVRDYYRGYSTGGWRSYSTAHDSGGNSLDAIPLARVVEYCKRSRCSYIEDVVVNVSKEYLENHSVTGVKFKLSGSGGEEVFSITGAYIKGFLAATHE